MPYCIINCTTSKKEDAVKIAKELIEKRLIACCNIVPNITSLYEWRNEIVEENEFLMIMKSETKLFSQVEEAIKALHPYEVPEIICTRIVEGSNDYLDWIRTQTK